jgi:hypothetical protein
MAVARVVGAGVGDSGGNTPAMRTALDALACLPADDDNDNKFANVGCRGGGGGGGRGTSGRMIINL